MYVPAPSAPGDSPVAPEQDLHRARPRAPAAAVRLTQPDGCLPVLVRPSAAPRSVGRAGDASGVAPATSGAHLRILFDSWLN